jgi:hypothetical protein
MLLPLLLAACHLTSVPVGPGDSTLLDTDVHHSDDTTDDSSSNDSLPDSSSIDSLPDDSSSTGDTSLPDDTAPPPPLKGLALVLDDDVVTMIHATWDDPGSTDAWVEYQFEGGDWRVAPTIGPGEAVILGIPGDTEVTARALAVVDDETRTSDTATITTGTVPSEVLVPTISSYEPDLAYEADYAMIVVATGSYTYSPPYWIEIFDRQGRIVWYQEVPDGMMTFYPTVSRDGTHIWFEAENIFGMGWDSPYVMRQTLDGRWSSSLAVPRLGEAIAEGPDDSFFFETREGNTHQLSRLDPDGTISMEWDCTRWFLSEGMSPEYCDMNTCNWDETRDTVLVSQFYSDTVFEIDLSTNEPIRQMGQLTIGDPYSFDPASAMFAYQHNPYWTDDDTILVSTHLYGRSGIQEAAEYEVDDATQTVERIWHYESTDMWATQCGEAIRLPNGNTTQGYGQDGGAREVTPDGEVVWQAVWAKDMEGYRVVGHLSLIPDLYALNVGP